MPRVGISYEQVAATAKSLQDAGEPVTIQMVRAALGTGSPNVIQRHLQAWRERDAKPVGQLAPSQQLVSAIGDELARAARDARAPAEERTAALTRDLAEMARHQQALESQLDEMRATLERTASEREQLRGRMDAADQGRSRLEQVIETLRETLATTDRAKVAAETSLMEARARLDGLEAEVRRLQEARHPQVESQGRPEASSSKSTAR